MLKKSLLLISISASLFCLKAQDVSVITNAVDVYSANPINGTAKYNAMAGSMGALGGDMSSINVNPAGLGVYITNDANLTFGINNNKNTTSVAGTSLNYTINKADFSNVGGVLSINLGDTSKWKFINIGVNYSYQSLENYSEAPGNSNIQITKTNFADSSGNQLTGVLTYAGHAYNRYGDFDKTNFAIGANYNNKIYLGAGLNFYNSVIHQYDSANFDVAVDNQTFSTTMDKQYTPYDEVGNGFSANVGIIAKLANQFRVGLAVETPIWWAIDRNFTEYNTNISGTTDTYTYGEDRKLSTPMKATLSAAFVLDKNFSLNVDFIQSLTKPRYKEYGPAEQELNDFFSDNYKNSSEVRIGAEYRIKNFRIRGGYAFQSSPFDNISILAFNDNGSISNNTYSNLILGSRSTIGAGLGYDFKAFYVDVSYQNISSEYKSPFLQGNSAFTSGYFNSGFDVNSDAYAVSNVKNSRNNIFLTVGWRF